jgi:phytoene dehydrogenase-like protein
MFTKKLSRRSFLSVSAISAATFTLDLKKVSACAGRMENKQAYPTVIIGAGLGGLCCGAYLAREGFPVTIIEQNDRPGGYATTFDRAGGKFTFDVSLHATTINNNALERTLKNLGVLDKVEVVEAPTGIRIKSGDVDVTFPQRDINKLIQVVSEHFPEEAEGIRNYMREMNALGDEADELAKKGMPYKLFFPFLYWELFTARNRTLADMLDEHMKDPKLKKIIGTAWPLAGGPQPSNFSGCIYAIMMKNFLQNGFQYVKPNSQALSDALAETITNAGGHILYETEVEKIDVQDGAVSGVTVSGGKTLPAMAVVSNASPLNTFHKMISRDVVPPEYLKQLKKHKPGLSSFIIWLGLNHDLQNLTKNAYIFQHSELTSEEDYQGYLSGDIENIAYYITIYDNIYKGYSHSGATTAALCCFTSYEPWKKFEKDYKAGNKKDYYAEKQRWTDILIQRAEKDIIPGLASMIEVKDAATPLTNQAYTGNTNGAICGFEQSMESSLSKRLNNRTPINGLYLAGAWCLPAGGYSGSIRSGEITFKMMLEDWAG